MPSPEVKTKIIRFCARRERSQREVNDKIRELQAPTQWLEELQQEGWWNQERFAKAYAFDHWNLHHWGKGKINQELKAEGVAAELRALAVNTIPQEEYILKLARMIQRKIPKEPLTEEKKYKLRMHFLRKGYTFADIEFARQDLSS
jgi:regulatory protein